MITEHARKRMQQRSISQDLLDLIDMIAIEGLQKGGTLIQQLPRQEIDNLTQKTKLLMKILSNAGKAYCVRNTDCRVITVGHKTRSLRTLS